MNIKSLVNYAKNIEKNNAAFEKLTKREQRVAIAKDAIAQVLLGRYVAECRTYVRSHDAAKVDELKEVNVPQCNVCAIGSVLVSSFRLTDDPNCIRNSEDWYGNPLGVGGMYYEGTIGAFREDMLRKMEKTFEHYVSEPENGFDYAKDEACGEPIDELMLIADDDARLFAILENVIENDGDYKPAKVRSEEQFKEARKAAKRVEKRFQTAKSKARAAFTAAS